MTHASKTEGARSGRGRRGRVVTVSLVLIVTSIVGLGLFPPNARAGNTYTYSGWNGYAGNQVIYMTTGVTDLASPIHISTITSPQGTQNPGVLPNALQFKTGQAANTTLPDLLAYEVYDPNAHLMRVYLPVSVGSATTLLKDYSGDIEQIFWQKISVTGSTGTGQIVDSNYNSGINATWGSTYAKGIINAAQLGALYNLTWDALGFLPGVGYITGGYSVMRDLEGLFGVEQTTTNLIASGTAPAYETFNIPIPFINCDANNICQIANQQVFAPQTRLMLTVPQSQFGTPSSFVVTASNTVGIWDASTGKVGYAYDIHGNVIQGATTSLSIPMLPADTLRGTIYVMGKGVANLAFSLQTTDAIGDHYVYNLKTDANGQYRFMAQPGVVYSICATYSTSFGGTSGCNSATMPNTEGSATLDLQLPVSLIQGTVTDASTGKAIYYATVVITEPYPPGYSIDPTTNSAGYFSATAMMLGTYKFSVGKTGYYTATGSLTVSAWGTTNTINFQLTPTGGGGGGGGCIVAGTKVTLAGGGTKAVNTLHAGDTVLGYDASTGTWVQETVTSNEYSFVGALLSINNGLLMVTLWDQPLYVRNGTWMGWVQDPQNLTIGEQLFLPSTGGWVSVTSLQILADTFKVYDLRVTAPNNFVANGVLVGDKPIPV